MFPESKVTEIYCMADDFCKEFTSIVSYKIIIYKYFYAAL